MGCVLAGKRPEWIPSFFDDCAFVHSIALDRKPGQKAGRAVDVFGTEFTQTVDGWMPVYSKTGEYALCDITKWKGVMPGISLSEVDWEEDARLIKAMHVKDGQVINYNAGWVWDQLHYMMGFEEALLALVLEPEACRECLDAIADFWIDAMRRLSKHLKPDLIMFMEHLATHRGLLMSPETYRAVIKPVHRKMFAAIAELGVPPEIHVDGYIEDLIPDFAEMGIKVIQPFQVMNDINRYKEQYDLVAIGGWDAFGPGNLEGATEEDIRASVRLSMDTYGPAYRYVFMESGLTPKFSGHIKYIKDEASRYGRAYYK